jgi:hypothetical protein
MTGEAGRSQHNSQHFLRKEKAPQRNPLQGLDLASGADRDRTGDPLLAKQVLSQLSYRPEDLAR